MAEHHSSVVKEAVRFRPPRSIPPSIAARDVRVEWCSRGEIRDFVEENHYSHSLNGVKTAACYRFVYRGDTVGAAVFGPMSTTAWKKFAQKESAVLELRRFVLLDTVGRNGESRLLSVCIRDLRGRHPEVEVLVSYADPAHGHEGTIYKASNFEYVGTSAKDYGYYDPENDRIYHSRSLRVKYKGRYKPFVVKLREKLDRGELTKVELPGKHCYIYRLKNTP